jgi:LysM repeat protein
MKRCLHIVLCLTAVPLSLAAQTLRGSRASVDLMFASAHAKDLAFLDTRSDIYEAAVTGELELLSITDDLTLERVKFPFVLPNTRSFTDSLAAEYRAACGDRLVVTSGTRPTTEQPRNASPKSVHPTGMAVDFRRPTGNCLTWLRQALLTLEQRHVIEATEERRPPHFHVAVLKQAPERPRSVIASAASSLSTDARAKVSASEGEIVHPARPVSTPTTVVTAAARATPSAAKPSAAKKRQTQAEHVAKKAAPGNYRVKAGDNLWTIARHHGTTTEKLQKLNGLKTTRLKVGQEIKLP